MLRCCRLFLFHVSGMVEKHRLAERFIVEMGVDLCRADSGMSEQFLDDTQTGTSFKQCGGEAVTQGMGRDGLLYSRCLAEPFHHDEDHCACEVMPAVVEKYIVFFARLDIHLIAVVKPEGELANSLVRDGHQPFLASLARHADEVLLQIEAAHLEVCQFGHTQSAGEEHLDDGTVAVALAG